MVRHPQGGTSVSTRARAEKGSNGSVSYRILTVFLHQENRTKAAEIGNSTAARTPVQAAGVVDDGQSDRGARVEQEVWLPHFRSASRSERTSWSSI